MWDEVIGQDRAVAMLQRAAERPVHAYLLVGPARLGHRDRGPLLRRVADRRGRRRARAARPSSRRRRVPARRDDVLRRARRARRDPARGAREPGRDRAQVRRAPRGGPLEPGVVEHAAEEHRGAAAAHDHHPGRRVRGRAPRHDPVALPADRLRRARHRRAARGARTSRGPRGAGAARGRHSPAGGSTARSRSTGPLAELRDAFVDVPARIDGSGATAIDAGRGAQRGRSRTRWPGSRPSRRPSSRSSRRRSSAASTRLAPRPRCASGSRTARSAKPAAPAPTRCSRASPRSSRCTATRSPTGSPALNGDRDRLAVNPAEAAAALRRLPRGPSGLRVQSERGSAARTAAAPPSGRCGERASLNSPTPPG